jgi:uncharacterized protein with PIN domain
MKFYADTPNLHIIRQRLVGNRTEHFELCVFDDKGELETEDKEVIRQLINIYRHDEEKPKDKTHKCSKCEAEFKTKKELGEHYKTEHPEKPTCKKCGAIFESKGLLLAHHKTAHPKK